MIPLITVLSLLLLIVTLLCLHLSKVIAHYSHENRNLKEDIATGIGWQAVQVHTVYADKLMKLEKSFRIAEDFRRDKPAFKDFQIRVELNHTKRAIIEELFNEGYVKRTITTDYGNPYEEIHTLTLIAQKQA